MNSSSHDRKLNLKVGDWVAIRSPEEILATLDTNARFEELPFMPQMLQYCGQKHRVSKRAHKLCDTALGTGGRQLPDSVILEGLRCDGQAFGGCEMECTLLWKESWLRRADEQESGVQYEPSRRLNSLVAAGAQKHPSAATSRVALYTCQATQVPAATSLLPVYSPLQYVEDYTSGNAPLSKIVAQLFFGFYEKLVDANIGLGPPLRWLYNTVQSAIGGSTYPLRTGHLPRGGPTPTVNLGLQEGETVRVKELSQILDTVDEVLVNRGMGFHPVMTRYCGKTFRVKKRINKLINERTGELKHLKNSCIVLDGADCHGRYTRPINCPRGMPPFWREIWLERVGDSPGSREDNTQAKPVETG